MADFTTVARPYARAVFDVAGERGELDAWSKALAVAAAIVADPAAHSYLGNPALRAPERAAFLADLCAGIADAKLFADGVGRIPIEERDPTEVTHSRGQLDDRLVDVRTIADGTAVSNFAFDVTPARLITGLITECGICDASEHGLAALFPEQARQAS